MKHIFTFIALLALLTTAHAQAPQGIPYQGAARNSSGAVLASTSISVRFSIRETSSAGTIKYQETHTATTTPDGIFSLTIGQGTPVTGTFAGINWSTKTNFLQVELDPAGGSSYVNMGTQQMMSVPYALNSASLKLNVSATGDTLYSGGGNYVLIPGISAANVSYSIGATYGGGKIAYILQPGDPGYVAGQLKGLIAAPTDNSTGLPWGCYGTNVAGTFWDFGTGASNTSIVSAACGAGTAARYCEELVLGGYSDWYLPSAVEAQKLFINRDVIGGFIADWYWTSSHQNSTIALATNFSTGGQTNSSKLNAWRVRAIRSFSCPETPNSITGTATVNIGNTTTLTSTTSGGTWSSSNTAVATVGTGGVVTGVAAGTAAISYTVTSYCGSASATVVVTVSAVTPVVGASFGGGVIAYIYIPGDPGYVAGETHGIIATTSDLASPASFGCSGITVSSTYTALGTGAANTALLSSTCGTGSAARICADLETGGYSDWHLPSRDELIKLYSNRGSIGGFVSGGYWSSSDNGYADYAYQLQSYGGDASFAYKYYTYTIRPVRYF